MYNKVLLTVVSCFIVAISGDFSASIFKSNSPENQQAFFERQLRQNVKVRNSAFQSPCFVQYLPQLDALNQQWSENDANCKSNASEQYDTILTDLEVQQAKLNQTADEIILTFNACEADPDPQESIKCLSTLYDSQAMVMNEMSNNASNVLFGFGIKVNVIKDNMYVCTNATQREYARESNKVYKELNYCLLYGPMQSTPNPRPPTAPTGQPVETTPFDF